MPYFDWNATAPPLDAVVDAMSVALREAWGNPSSVHATGRAARARVEAAREAVARLAGCDARDVLLVSGGTEANNIALRSAFTRDGASADAGTTPNDHASAKRVLVTSRIEHPSITKVAEALAREGRAEVRWLAVRQEGTIDLADLERALAPGDVKLVGVQAVNGETGVVQPIAEAIALAKKHGARVHVDAVQAFGKIDPKDTEAADTRSIAAHKMRGPKGIGALVSRAGVRLEPVLVGGSQERGLRPGTVDPVTAAGFAACADHARAPETIARRAAIATRRDGLERGLLLAAKGARVNGTAERVPHVTNVWFPGWAGAELVAALDLEGLHVSSGSACSAGTTEPSPVLAAMFGAEAARGTESVRFSLGEATTDDDVAQALAIAARVLGRANR